MDAGRSLRDSPLLGSNQTLLIQSHGPDNPIGSDVLRDRDVIQHTAIAGPRNIARRRDQS